jgi:hypothetical protein
VSALEAPPTEILATLPNIHWDKGPRAELTSTMSHHESLKSDNQSFVEL